MTALKELAYFPGCSMESTAKENHDSMKAFFKRMGYRLKPLPDWSCCGSTSAHSLSRNLGIDLASRNLSLAEPDVPLLVACPSCTLRLRESQSHIAKDADKQAQYKAQWGKSFNPDLKIVHFFDVLDEMLETALPAAVQTSLNGMRIAPYYGCMLARSPEFRKQKSHYGLMEKVLSALGAEPVSWSHHSKCCGTFLSVTKPAIAGEVVQNIIQGAHDYKADAIVTACSMCQLNLEMRCKPSSKLPVYHLSELLGLAVGDKRFGQWFNRHLVQPAHPLKARGVVTEASLKRPVRLKFPKPAA